MDATQSIYDKATGTSTTDTVTEPTDAEAERRSAQSTSGSGLGAAAQHLASVKSGLSDRRTLVVKLVIVTQKEEIVTQATLDTGSEVDIVSPDFARQLWHAGARYGDRGGCIKVIGGGVVQPEGSMRVAVEISANANADLKLPRRLRFECEPSITQCPTPLLIGYKTLLGTGLLDIVLGIESYEREIDADGLDIECDWPEPDEGCEWPTLVGTADEKAKLHELCMEFKDVFGACPVGGSKLPAMDITLKKNADGSDMLPRPSLARRTAPWIRQLIREDADKRLKNGWYERGGGRFASPIVAAKQPNKGPDARRICADYREVNRCAEQCIYPTKNIKDVTKRLAGAKYFATADARSGYHQIRLTERAAELLCVITEDGLFTPKTAPFGLHGLPSYFQQAMSEIVFKDIETFGVETFLDDINVNATNFEDFLSRLREVFTRLREWELRLNGGKTTLGGSECTYLGHHVDGDGFKHLERRFEALKNIQPPKNRSEVKSFLGLVNYFRESGGMDFAYMLKPLNDLTRKGQKFNWTTSGVKSCQHAFEAVKETIVKNQKLHFIDYALPIFVRTDASEAGCGAQLFQVKDGREVTCSYLSKTFTDTEARWSVFEQELFAVVWAVKKWHQELLGAPFTVLTDHRNLLQLHKSIVPKVVRWRLALQPYTFDIQHVEGRTNYVADALSRLHGRSRLQKVASGALLTGPGEEELIDYEEFTPDPAVIATIRAFHNCIVGHAGVNRMEAAVRQAHADGQLSKLPINLRQHIRWFKRHCPECQKLEFAKVAAKGPLSSLHVTQIGEEMSVDVIGPLPKTKDGYEYIIVAIDGFSRNMFAQPAKSTTALEAAEFLLSPQMAGQHGFPKAIRADNARQFNNHLLDALLKLTNVERHHSIPWRPQSNGLVERANKELIRHLRYIVFDRRIVDAWDTVLGMAVRIINTTKHASIGVSPAQLFSVGRDLDRQLLPSAVPAETKQYIDTLIPNDKRRREAVHQYISHLTSMQAEVVRAANEWQDKVVQRRVVDRQPETVRAFKQGDWVVHRHFGNRRPTKLSPLWIGPYQVLDQASNSMYRLQDPADLKEHLCHIDELYEYRMGLTDDVVDVIALDQFEAIVHSIVDHRAVGKSKSQWVFRVRFVDCDPSEDVWLPFAEANQLSAMDEYLDLPHNRKLGLA